MHAWSQRVTTQQGGRNGPWPPTAIPTLHPQPSSASAAATLSNQSLVSVGATVGGSLKAEEMHRAFSSSSNYGEQRPALLLVTTFVLARKTLPPPVRPAGHGNPPMRRLSLGPAPSYRSSSNNTNTVSLPPTPPIAPSSVIPFVTPACPFVTLSSCSLFNDCSTGRPFA